MEQILPNLRQIYCVCWPAWARKQRIGTIPQVSTHCKRRNQDRKAFQSFTNSSICVYSSWEIICWRSFGNGNLGQTVRSILADTVLLWMTKGKHCRAGQSSTQPLCRLFQMQRARRLHEGPKDLILPYCQKATGNGLTSQFIFSRDNLRLGTNQLLWAVKSVRLLENKNADQTRIIWWNAELQEQLVTAFLVCHSHRHSVTWRKTTDNILSRMQNSRGELTLPRVDSYISSPVLDSVALSRGDMGFPRSTWISNLPVSISNEEILFPFVPVHSHWVQQTFSGNSWFSHNIALHTEWLYLILCTLAIQIIK